MERSASVADTIQHRKAATGGERSSGFACLARITGVARLMPTTESKAVPAGLVELEHDLRIAVDEVQRVVRSDAQAVRVLEDTVAPRVEQLAGLVEDDVWVFGAGEDVDVVLRVDGNGADLAPHPSGRQFAPTAHELILAFASVDHNAFADGCHPIPLTAAYELRPWGCYPSRDRYR